MAMSEREAIREALLLSAELARRVQILEDRVRRLESVSIRRVETDEPSPAISYTSQENNP